MIIDFYYTVNVYFHVSFCTINHAINVSILVYYYIFTYRLLSCIMILTNKYPSKRTSTAAAVVPIRGDREQ